MTHDTHEIEIKAKHSSLSVNFKELWQYRDLIGLFVIRNFKLIYKQTVLGPLWLIITPLFTSVVFTAIFGQVAGMSTDGVPQFLFYMAGNTMWSLFFSAVTGTANTFVHNAGVFSKIYFPRLTVPISQVITSLLNFGIQFALLFIIYLYYVFTDPNIILNVNILFIVPILLQCIILGLAVGIIVSSLTTKYRDLAFAVTFGMQLWMYATPVVYPISTMSGTTLTLLLLNPVTPLVHNFKYALFGTGGLLLQPWALSIFITLVLLIWGVTMFNKIEKTFMDTV